MEKFIYKNSLDITTLKASMQNFSYKKHAHEEYALGVTLKGIQKYNLDGHSKASYKNGVVLFNPEQVHDGQAGSTDDSLEYVMLYIKPKLFLEAIDKKDIVRFSSPIVYEQKLRNDILNLTSSILNQKDEALSSELFLNLMDNFTKEKILASYKSENNLVKKAKEIIYYELDDILDLETISNELNLTKFQFIRLFKANTGITPYQYFLSCKITNAKKYLEETRDLYATVVEFGFSDLSHLNKHFKNIYGVTAYEYLQSLNRKR
ncbi:AraC family transcriptional regulator [Campylobacterota bacterium DY0563]